VCDRAAPTAIFPKVVFRVPEKSGSRRSACVYRRPIGGSRCCESDTAGDAAMMRADTQSDTPVDRASPTTLFTRMSVPACWSDRVRLPSGKCPACVRVTAAKNQTKPTATSSPGGIRVPTIQPTAGATTPAVTQAVDARSRAFASSFTCSLWTEGTGRHSPRQAAQTRSRRLLARRSFSARRSASIRSRSVSAR
jgi:hypothetical protein